MGYTRVNFGACFLYWTGDNSQMGWHAAYTEHGRELFARDNLRARGVETICLFDSVTRRIKVRGQNAYRVVVRDEPLFPHYLFVNTVDYACVRETRGVVDLVKSGGVPLCMPHRVIERLRALAGPDGCMTRLDTTKPSFHFKAAAGDRVEFVKGSPLYGLIGRIASIARLDESGEVTAWVNMLGGERQIEVPYTSLAAITGSREPSIATSVAA